MEQVDLIQKAKTGDMDAFSEWMDQHSDQIERLAIQLGNAGEIAGEVTERIFRAFHKKLEDVEDEEQAQFELYRIAVELLDGTLLSDTSEVIFKFEEDENLHRKIVGLEKELKFPFILFTYHDKTLNEIAEICSKSEKETQLAIDNAWQQLSGQQLEKRLQFLGKSYNRLRPSFKKENVMNPKKESVEKAMLKKTRISKKSLLIWIAGIFLLMAIVTVPVVTSEEYRASAAERYVERLTSTFDKEMETTYTRLGFSEPVLEKNKEEHYQDYIGQDVRSRFTMLVNNIEMKIERGESLDKNSIQKEYDDIIRDLELPSEMVERLLDNPLTGDLIKSEEFIEEYTRKYFMIQNGYYMIIANHENVISQALADDKADVQEFLIKSESTPDELRNALKAMKEENMELLVMNEWNSVYPSYMENGMEEKIRASLHPDVGGYIVIVSSRNQIYNKTIDESNFEEMYDFLLDMERTLLATKLTSEHYHHLSNIYVNLFHILTIGMYPDERFGVDGKLKSEYRAMWDKLADTDGNSPSAFAMQKVIDLMKENEWQKPANFDYMLSPLYEAVEAAREGKLDSFTWIVPNFHEQSIEEDKPLTLEDGVIATDDLEYKALVESTYKSLSSIQNRDIMNNVTPLVVLGVYLYAYEQEDPGTMWLLSNRDSVGLTKKEFIDTWDKQKLEIDSAEKLFAEQGMDELNGVPLIPIRYEMNGQVIYDGWFIWNEESERWEIETAPKITKKD